MLKIYGKQFYPISIRGRIAYVIFCFENYTKVKYHDVDIQPVLRLMWSVVDSSDYIDNSKRRETNQTHRCAVFRLDIDIHFIPKPPPFSRASG